MEVTQVSWIHDSKDVSHVHIVGRMPAGGRKVDLDNHPQYINTFEKRHNKRYKLQ